MSDIEIGRYGLRTFRLSGKGLHSLYKPTTWHGGKAIAGCLSMGGTLGPLVATFSSVRDWNSGIPFEGGHAAPADSCTCGLYSCTTLQSLVRQYGEELKGSGVAVVAAEGNTIVGEQGMRTAAARIVAYWTWPTKRWWSFDWAAHYYRKHVPTAIHYTDMAKMLSDYKFEPYDAEFPYRDHGKEKMRLHDVKLKAEAVKRAAQREENIRRSRLMHDFRYDIKGTTW